MVVEGLGGLSLVVDRPHDDVFFLGEDLFAGVVAGGRFDPHRPPIGRAASAVDFLWIEVDALVEHGPGGPFQECGPIEAVDPGVRAEGVAQGLGDVEAMPRRTPLGELGDHIADRDLLAARSAVRVQRRGCRR